LREAQNAAQNIADAFEQVMVLALLARYLPEVPPVPDERLQEALRWARSPSRKGNTPGVLHIGAARLDRQERRNMEREITEKRLSALGPYRPEPSPQEAAEALHRDEGRRQQVEERIVALTEQPTPEYIASLSWQDRDQARLRKLIILTEALEIARGIHDTDERARALTELVPYLDELLQPVILESDSAVPEDVRWITVAQQREKVVEGPKALHDLAPYLAQSSLPNVLNAIKAIEDSDEREESLRTLISRLGSMDADSFRRPWSEALRVFASRTRERLLLNLSEQLPVLIRLAGAEALDQTANAVRDVARWYS